MNYIENLLHETLKKTNLGDAPKNTHGEYQIDYVAISRPNKKMKKLSMNVRVKKGIEISHCLAKLNSDHYQRIKNRSRPRTFFDFKIIKNQKTSLKKSGRPRNFNN